MASRPESLHDDLADQLGFLDCDADGPRPGRVHHLQPRRERLPQARRSTTSSATTAGDVTLDAGRARPSPWSRSSTRPASRPQPARMPAAAAHARRAAAARSSRSLISNHLDDIQPEPPAGDREEDGHPDRRDQGGDRAPPPAQPAPGARSRGRDSSQYVLPDLIVEANEHGEYEVRLADDHTPQLAISRQYQRMLKNKPADPADPRVHPEEDPVGPVADRVDRAAAEHPAEGRPGDHRAPEGLPRQGPRVDRAAEDAADRRPRRASTSRPSAGPSTTSGSRPPGASSPQAVLRRRHHHDRRRGSRVGHDQAEAARDHRQGRQAEPALATRRSSRS